MKSFRKSGHLGVNVTLKLQIPWYLEQSFDSPSLLELSEPLGEIADINRVGGLVTSTAKSN